MLADGVLRGRLRAGVVPSAGGAQVVVHGYAAAGELAVSD